MENKGTFVKDLLNKERRIEIRKLNVLSTAKNVLTLYKHRQFFVNNEFINCQ